MRTSKKIKGRLLTLRTSLKTLKSAKPKVQAKHGEDVDPVS